MRLYILNVWWGDKQEGTAQAIGVFSSDAKADAYAKACGYKHWTVTMCFLDN